MSGDACRGGTASSARRCAARAPRSRREEAEARTPCGLLSVAGRAARILRRRLGLPKAAERPDREAEREAERGRERGEDMDGLRRDEPAARLEEERDGIHLRDRVHPARDEAERDVDRREE